MKNILIVFIIILQAACSEKIDQFTVNQLQQVNNDELASSIQKYYELESNKNWVSTYMHRSRVFVETVSFELYQKEMKTSSNGWRFLKATVVDVEAISNNEYDIYLEFYSNRNGHNYRFTERTNWVKEGGQWKSNIPGKRGLFVLNDWVKQ